jgi:hypothetical protein
MATRIPALRVLVFAAMALFVALGFPRRASAGTLQIRDEAHVLAAGDAERLRAQVQAAPFDARLVFTTDYPDPGDLSRFVGSLVDGPNAVAVGVDPRHRHVQVHFGRGSGIARSEWSAIETAGNGDFRDGNWAGGAGSILRTASQSVTGGPASSTPTGPAAPGLGSALLWFLLIGGGIAALALFSRRRSGYGMGGYPGYGGGPYAGGPYGGQPGGLGPVGGGMIGAGLGGLAGYEIGKMEGEREERDRDERDRGGFDDNRDGGFDAGGGGSSWDSGSGDGGGGDGGGFGGGDGGGSDF